MFSNERNCVAKKTSGKYIELFAINIINFMLLDFGY